MIINLVNSETKQFVQAEIRILNALELPQQKDGWKFDWSQLIKTDGSFFYRISLLESPAIVEGVIMLSLYNQEMVFMNNLEIAPWNIGSGKRYDRVAACLIAFGCKLAMETGKGAYQGYLTFVSKTQLLQHYEKKYGAKRTTGLTMYIDPIQSEKLIYSFLDTSYQ